MADRDPIKVYDARWEAGAFTHAEVRRLFEATFAYGRGLGVDTVTLARDARLAGPQVLEIAVQAALTMGLRVFLTPNPISTPQSYFTTLHVTAGHPKTMGLTVTASHNPAEYIGIKFVIPVVQAIGFDCGPEGGLAAVRRLYHSAERFAAPGGGSLHLLDLQQEYIAYSLEQAGVRAGSLAGLQVVLDAFHGSAGPEIFEALALAGAQVESLRLIPNGHFPTGSPNPTSHGKMNGAVELARSRGCHAVLGVDGDGDRIVFGDARGVLSAGFAAIPVLQAEQLDPRNPAPVLYDPKVNPLALAEWGRLGAAPVLFRNGHSQIKDYMRRIGAVAGAEESGHYYHRMTRGHHTVYCENTIITIALFLRALAANPAVMDDLWALQNSIATTGEFNYQFADDETRDRALAAVIDHFTSQGARAVTATPDGIDLEGTVLSRGVESTSSGYTLAPAWFSGYLRVATNERSVVRSYFSAADAATLAGVERQTRKMLEEVYGGKIIE